MTPPQRGPAPVTCAVCGQRVYRMHAVVALVRRRDDRFEARTVCLGYCRTHREHVRAQLSVRLRRLGEVVAHTRAVLVRPERRTAWEVKALRIAREHWRESLGDTIVLSTPQLEGALSPTRTTPR